MWGPAYWGRYNSSSIEGRWAVFWWPPTKGRAIGGLLEKKK